jgi:N-formylglutamate amidohydrolase
MSSIVLHIPHASRKIPEDVQLTFRPDEAAIERELLVMTDHFTDEIVAGFRAEVERVIFGVSRLVVDPERFPDDANEPMAARGMGATYTRLSSGEPLRVLSATERRRLMETYYYPHHARLENAVEQALTQYDRCLIIDVHSFSSAPLPHEPDQTPWRPEVCIGFDRFHSPFRYDADVLRACREMQFYADINRPFSGSIVPRRYLNADARVRSFMIEVRRDLYMTEETGIKRANFSAASIQVCALIRELVRVGSA